MKKTWLKYLFIGLGLYLIIVLVRFPADIAYGFVANSLKTSPAKVQLYRVGGTLWNGKAQFANVQGQTLHDLRWELHLLSILTGKVGATLSFKLEDGSVKATAYRGLGGSISLEDVKARLPVAEIIRMARIPAVKLEGQLGLNFSELAMSDGIVNTADGRVVWNGAESQFPQRIQLGDLSATIKTTDKGIEAKLGDAGGPLQLNGLFTLAPDGKYDFNGELAAREGSNSNLGRSLSMMGRPDAQGKVKIANSGNLKDFNFLFK